MVESRLRVGETRIYQQVHDPDDTIYFNTIRYIRLDQKEQVDHPEHYNNHPAGIECIDVVEEMSFNIGNAIKYLWRNGLKDGQPADQDLRKAIWYIEREISRCKESK